MHSWAQIEAEKAFSSATRARRRASVARRLRGCRGACGRLPVHDDTALRSGSATGLGLREIPLEAISGTVEPNRAAQFDREFRPAGPTRSRWQSVWLAAQRGAQLPPISVVPVGDAYAIRDGHHRVSVARARGALTIDAIVGTA
ncbi:MAG TPA: hypothetical protein VF024_05475 [Solirubrobacteraceae bacterium]